MTKGVVSKRGSPLFCAFNIFEQITWLTVKHDTNLFKHIKRQVLSLTVAKCRNCRRPDTRFFCKFLLCHISFCKHYLYPRLNHSKFPLSTIMHYTTEDVLCQYAKRKLFYGKSKNITKKVLTYYEYRSIIKTQSRKGTKQKFLNPRQKRLRETPGRC